MGLDVTYRLCSVPKKKKGKYLLMQFSAEATFQALINAEEDRHIVH